MAAKYKVVRKAPFISKKEVQQTKDFDKVLSRLQGEHTVSTGFALKYKIFAGVALLIGGLIFTLYQSNLISDTHKNTTQLTEKEGITSQKNDYIDQEVIAEKQESAIAENNMAIVELDVPQDNHTIKVESEIINNNIQEEQPIITQQDTQPVEKAMNTGLTTAEALEKVESVTTYTTDALAYSEATPLVGFDSLYRYFANSINYPDSLKEHNIEGQVTVSFTINEAGKAENIQIMESLHEALDKEAIRIVTQMPFWTPAKAYGEPLASNMSIPITFQLK